MNLPRILAASLCALFAVVGCGGGGGGGSTAAPAPLAVEPCPVGDLATDTAPAVNALRASPQVCGGVPFPAVGSVAWNDRLAAAAQAHSSDMARQGFFGHTGSNGLTVGDRAAAAGYVWTVVAENIAAGPASLQTVLIGWMNSTGHCENLMRANVTDIGLSCMRREGSGQTAYWTLVLARP